MLIDFVFFFRREDIDFVIEKEVEVVFDENGKVDEFDNFDIFGRGGDNVILKRSNDINVCIGNFDNWVEENGFVEENLNI